MKNLFFVLAFMLIGTFAFANPNENLEKISETNLSTVVFDDLVTNNNYTFSSNQYLEQGSTLADCTLKGKFTITLSNGDKISWEGTLTIVGQSCTEFLKEMMKQ